MKEQTNKINWILVILFLLLGVILGMVIMYLLFTFSFERILDASDGIIQNVNIDFNETKVVDGITNWVYNSDKFSNITYTNYTR